MKQETITRQAYLDSPHTSLGDPPTCPTAAFVSVQCRCLPTGLSSCYTVCSLRTGTACHSCPLCARRLAQCPSRVWPECWRHAHISLRNNKARHRHRGRLRTTDARRQISRVSDLSNKRATNYGIWERELHLQRESGVQGDAESLVCATAAWWAVKLRGESSAGKSPLCCAKHRKLKRPSTKPQVMQQRTLTALHGHV